jgi:hypothetical protein
MKYINRKPLAIRNVFSSQFENCSSDDRTYWAMDTVCFHIIENMRGPATLDNILALAECKVFLDFIQEHGDKTYLSERYWTDGLFQRCDVPWEPSLKFSRKSSLIQHWRVFIRRLIQFKRKEFLQMTS